MEIRFQSKDESNKQQEQAFLALSPVDRFIAFIRLSNQILKFPTKASTETKSNFVLELKKKC
jgi:hypothetical protein